MVGLDQNRKLRILCFGAGAIGSYIGGSLAIQGHEVHFLDRPETLEKIKQNGIQLQLPGGKFTIEPDFLWSSIEDAISNSFDFSIVAVKSYDTDGLIQNWSNFADNFPPVVCFQNGVENEDKIGMILGKDKVIRGTVTTAIGRNQNEVIVEKLRGVGIEHKNQLTSEIISAMQKAGLNAIAYNDPLAMKWSKLLTNLTTNASSAILSLPPSDILSDRELFKIEIEELRETIKVMRAMKIKIIDLPGTPVRLFSFVVDKCPIFLSQFILKNFISKGRGGKMPSFYIDFHSNRKKSEVDYLNGAVVRFGNKFGVDTPTNKILNSTLIQFTNEEIPINDFAQKPEAYKKLFKKS